MKIWKEHIEKIMNKEIEWDQVVKTDVVEEPMEKVTCKEIVVAMQNMKSEKTTEPIEISVEMIVASSEIGVKVMMELCQQVLQRNA